MEHKSLSASFIRTTALVAGINILSKVLGVAREALVAGAFGAREATDAFFTAWRLPDVLFNSLLGVLVANTFIPVLYELTDSHGEDAARRFTAAATGAALLILAVLALAYALFAPGITSFLAPGLTPEGSRMAARMARILAPVVLAGGLTGVFRSLLHARRDFLLPACLPVVQNLCVIAMLLTLAASLGVEVLAWSLFLSSILQACMLFVPLGASRAVPLPRLDLADPGLKRMGALMLPVLTTFALGNVIPLLEVHLASRVSTGAISYLSYAYRLFTLPEQIFALALSAVLFPFLARDASRGDHRSMTGKFSMGLRLSLYLMFPLGTFLAVYSRDFVRLFLGWGAFDAAAVHGTGLTLTAYAGGLFAVCARNLLVDACFALKSPGLILKAATLMIPFNAALDLWLCGLLGAPGLSLGFSLTAVAHCLLLALALRTRLEGFEPGAILMALGRSALAGMLVGGLCWWTRPFMESISAGGGFAARLAGLSLAGFMAALAYVVVQAALRSPEQAQMLRLLRRREVS